MRSMSREEAVGFLLSGTRNGVPGEVVVRLHIEKIIAKDDIAG